MEPFTFVAGSLAVIFALLALLQWRRAEDLEKRVQELEAKHGDGEPREPAKEEPPAKAEEPEEKDEDEDEDEEDEDEEDEDEEELAAAPKAPVTEPEPAPPPKSEPPVKAASEPPPPKPASVPPPKAASEPPPKAAEPDNSLRLEALKVVADAFELARYLDFDAIVEKPATYRVTVPITAANSRAVRHLQEGMFPCLAHVSIEERNAILHIDTTKGPP